MTFSQSLLATALAEDPARNLILAPFFAAQLDRSLPALRRVIAKRDEGAAAESELSPLGPCPAPAGHRLCVRRHWITSTVPFSMPWSPSDGPWPMADASTSSFSV